MKPFEFVICIPARYQSSRLPGKPLIKLKGKELILRAVESAHRLGAKEVTVATDDARIFDCVKTAGYDVVMTAENHLTGTDRIAECAAIKNWSSDTWVLNYQGDEPNIPRDNVQQVLDLIQQSPEAAIGTLYQPITNLDTLFDPNVVKVVTNDRHQALYFSRAPIPWSQQHFNQQAKRLPENVSFKRHIGLYVYKVAFLHQFSRLKPAAIEQCESLEQLRALAAGEQIVVARAVCDMPHGIDTADDVMRFEQDKTQR
ncbi:3-deoxy-manno-octulosonate cytidylyltransferase [Marinicella gelatinilytica]|uniref:3-deoxy-manno-octulosonate cytidylyltransferase n=1 Tax=Marinicella gelatinilytica TaxID=2996017 RepID=UPI002260BC3C|nr:3-deoxy-manno-octulosonate cytidylyltransferase [Marinicella gelatinilytica]MCX7544747.1 3-deoxy-manno-octulosonate cytidylyltransferase [Marinicella gelatinilytica]